MNNVSEEMRHLHQLAKREPSKRFDHLWELLTDPAWLMQAWEEIRSNKGSMTAGIDTTIAVDIDPERIQSLSKRVANARRNPEYRKIENRITRLRRQLKQTLVHFQ